MSQHRYHTMHVTRYTQIARLRVAEHHRALELVRQDALLAVWPNMASTREKTRSDGAELGRSAKTMRAVPQCEPTSGWWGGCISTTEGGQRCTPQSTPC